MLTIKEQRGVEGPGMGMLQTQGRRRRRKERNSKLHLEQEAGEDPQRRFPLA